MFELFQLDFFNLTQNVFIKLSNNFITLVDLELTVHDFMLKLCDFWNNSIVEVLKVLVFSKSLKLFP